MALTTVGTVFSLRLWQADPRVPFALSGDAGFVATMVKTTLDHGWYLNNPALGAPFGAQFHDIPYGADNLQLLMIKALGLVTHDWALVMNAYFLLTFALVAAAAYVVFRQLRLSTWTSAGLATLFSLLPFHFFNGQTFLWVSGYFAVPLGAFLVLDALGWDVWGPPLPARVATSNRLRWLVRAAMCAVIASAGTYYAPFTMLLVAFAAALGLVARPNLARVGRAVAVVALIGVVFAVNLAPTLLYRRSHGPNVVAMVRGPEESEVFGLRVVDLVLPVAGHRLPPLADLRSKFAWESPIWPAYPEPLGVAGATGLLLSLLVAAGLVMRPARGVRAGPRRTRVAQLGILNVAAILIAVPTGFSAVLAAAGITQVRTWQRMQIFIAFFAFAALGLAVEALLSRPWARSRTATMPWAIPAVAGIALVLAFLDQVPTVIVPAYASNRTAFTGDRAFVQEIENRLDHGDAVFELPLSQFPEHDPIAGLADYDLLRPYLHSDDLRWSFASMRGRPTDWAWSLGGRPLPAFLDDIVAAGFSGLYVDRAGFLDRAVGLERELAGLVGPPDMVGTGGALLFWDLRAEGQRQLAEIGSAGVADRRRLVLSPVVPRWTAGTRPAEGDPAAAVSTDYLPYPAVPGQRVVSRRLASSPAVLELTNPLETPRPVRLDVSLVSATGGSSSVTISSGTISSPGTPDATFPVSPDPTRVSLDLVLPPGPSSLRFVSDTASPSGYWSSTFALENLGITDRPAGSSP